MINIVAYNVGSSGGLNLLTNLIRTAERCGIVVRAVYKRHSRFKLIDRLFQFYYFIKFNVVNSRYGRFYFGNIPPVFSYKRTYVYFHNVLILSPWSSLICENQWLLLIQKLIIHVNSLYFKDKTIYLVQTELVRSRLKNYTSAKIEVYPFWPKEEWLDAGTLAPFDILCPTGPFSHKNNALVIQALSLLKRQNYRLPKVVMTVGRDEMDKPSMNLIRKFNLPIVLTGRLPLQLLHEYMAATRAVMITSEKESFGLPIIEAFEYKKCLIAPRLPYVEELVADFLEFESGNPESLAEAMKSVSENRECDLSLLVENRVLELIELINV